MAIFASFWPRWPVLHILFSQKIWYDPNFREMGTFLKRHFSVFTALKHCTKFRKSKMHGSWQKAVIYVQYMYRRKEGRTDITWYEPLLKAQSNVTTLVLKWTLTSSLVLSTGSFQWSKRNYWTLKIKLTESNWIQKSIFFVYLI